MNAAFSPRYVQDFEVYMDPNIVLLVKALLPCTDKKSEGFDFHRWGKRNLLVSRFSGRG
jgi:hypothetical protein